MNPSFTREEKLFVLAEIIKASRIDVESLVHFIKYHNIEPDWMNMQIPLGRNMNQCMQFAEHISIATSSLKRRPSSDDFGHPSKRLAFSDMPEQTRPTSSPGILQPAPPPPPSYTTAYTTAHTAPSNGFVETSPQPPVPVMAKKRGRPSRADKAKRDLRPLLPQHLAPRPPAGAVPPQVPSPPAARPILPAIGSPRDFRRGPLDPRSWSPPSLYRVSPGVEEKSPARHQERIVEGDHSRPQLSPQGPINPYERSPPHASLEPSLVHKAGINVAASPPQPSAKTTTTCDASTIPKNSMSVMSSLGREVALINPA